MKKDYEIVRELAKQCAEIAADPANDERKKLWHKLNGLKAERPMYIIDELPWHELNGNGELTLYCENDVCRTLERDLKRRLYRYNHFHDDFVFEPYIDVLKSIHGTKLNASHTGIAIDFGITIEEDTIKQSDEGVVSAHAYHDQLQTEEDLLKYRCPDLYLNEEETAYKEEVANEAIGDALKVRMNGITPRYDAWDQMIQYRSVESVLFGMIEDPDFMHKTVRHILDVSLEALDKLEEQGLLAHPQNLIHCTGAWSDELPEEPVEGGKFRARDIWTYGMAQILYTVSPELHNEFEFEYAPEWYGRFGLGYYGCCEPLEDRMEYVKRIPNIRKISTSAFVRNYDRMSEAIEQKYVMSFKPAPSLVTHSAWNPEVVEKNLRMLLKSAQRYGNTCEFTLKDISTVEHHPEHLTEWSEIMRRVINEG